jgi:hypothetical protein
MTSTGAVVMGVFAAFWWVAGITASGHGSVAAYAVPAVVTGAILAAAWGGRGAAILRSAADEARVERLVGIASAVERVAILVVINVLANVGARDFIVPVSRSSSACISGAGTRNSFTAALCDGGGAGARGRYRHPGCRS